VTSTDTTAIKSPSENLTDEQIQSIIRLAERRNVLLESDGENLRVRGEPSAVAVLRPWLTKAKAAIVEYLAKNPQQNPSPVATSQNEKGQGERREERQDRPAVWPSPTPLEILSRLHLSFDYRPWRPSPVDIELVLWLTQAAINCQRDGSGNIVDAGIVIDTEGRPTNISQTITLLCRGPQVDRRETPATWLERIAKFKTLLDCGFPNGKWRASTGWRSSDWPAELKVKPKPVVEFVPPRPNPVEKKKVTSI